MSELIEKLIAAAREYGADASLETANAEMDAQIALFAALGRKDEEYRQLRAELNEEQAKFTQLRHAADELMGQVYSWANGHVGVVVSVELSDAYYRASLLPSKGGAE